MQKVVRMNDYTWRTFLRDRRPYIIAYAAFGLLTAVVVQLDLMLHGGTLQFANVVYIVVLGFIGLAVFLFYDYRRQASFFHRLRHVVDSGTIDEMSVLEPPATLEQQLYADAWAGMYGRLRTEFAQEQLRNQRRLHFLSQWAHHMKTPVSVIDLELQKAGRDAAGYAEELVRSVAEENERLQQSLQALLNTIRLDEFASDFKLEPVHLPAIARQVINDYRHAFIAHRVYPKIELPEPHVVPAELLTVHSDAKWLRLILEQIVSNAIKYSSDEKRDGHVTIRVQRVGSDTVLEVADNGIGIPPEDLGRVFDPFFTGAAGRTHSSSTGLGLYLAREAAQRLGHQLTIRSTPGAGTAVRIRFARDASIFAGLRTHVTAT